VGASNAREGKQEEVLTMLVDEFLKPNTGDPS
jgi:hypothetical protein